MKSNFVAKTAVLLTAIFLTCTFSMSFAQKHTNGKKEVHVIKVVNINGKVTTTDSTFEAGDDFEFENMAKVMHCNNDTSMQHSKKIVMYLNGDTTISCVPQEFNGDEMPEMFDFEIPQFDFNFTGEDTVIFRAENDTLSEMKNELRSMQCGKHKYIVYVNPENFNLPNIPPPPPIPDMDDFHFDEQTFTIECDSLESGIEKSIQIIINGDTIIENISVPKVYVNVDTCKKVMIMKGLPHGKHSNKEHFSGKNCKVMKINCRVNELSETEKNQLKSANSKIKLDSPELQLDKLQYFPNPTNGKITLSFSSQEKGTTYVKIFNALGKEVYNEKLKNFDGSYSNEIDLSGKDKGTYFMQISSGKKATVKKIILQ